MDHDVTKTMTAGLLKDFSFNTKYPFEYFKITFIVKGYVTRWFVGDNRQSNRKVQVCIHQPRSGFP